MTTDIAELFHIRKEEKIGQKNLNRQLATAFLGDPALTVPWIILLSHH